MKKDDQNVQPLRLDGQTLVDQLQTLASVGTDPRGGRTRLAASKEEGEGRDLLVEWMKELDLEVTVDSVGNIFGLLSAEEGRTEEKPLVLGSHIDTVLSAGPYDGCFGVLSALAVARAFRTAGRTPSRPLVVAAFTNEEGVRFQPDMLGSLCFAGGISPEEALAVTDSHGVSLEESLKEIGYNGPLTPGFFVPGEYLELHVEQGPILDREGLSIGVVEGVQGISWWKIAFAGKANHAGTTPTALRSDAGYGAARTIVFLRELALSSGTTLGTAGTLSLEPGAVNIIPSKAVFTADIRDPSEERLAEADEKLKAFAEEAASAEGLEVTLERLARFSPVEFSESLCALVEETARELGLSSRRMTSGAGHDAQMMARICPTAMIFVPSRGGISHNPDEHTDRADLLAGAEVLLRTAEKLLAKG